LTLSANVIDQVPAWVFALGGGVLGLIVGSFIATLVIRWPQGRSVMQGRSLCDQCGNALSARELVPIISALIQRGKCRQCGAEIASSHFAIELAAAAIGAAALCVAPGWQGFAGALFGWLLLALGALDAAHFWLPNQLTATLALSGLGAGLLGLDPPLAERLWGGFAGYLSLALVAFAYKLIRKREGLGGGDPKLLGAIGLWLGWQMLPYVVSGASGLGLLFALLGAMRGRSLSATDRLPLGALLALAAFPIWIVALKP
jgi:leader peptidase (prepilin peptidase) / N-methyltransferase